MRRIYNQKNLSVTINGYTIRDYFDGATVVLTYDGGEVQKTQGTDGAGINLATEQGLTIQVTLRETSQSHAFLHALRLSQYTSNTGCTVIVRTGADILFSLPDSFISSPGPLTTGDKMQGSVQYTITSADGFANNLAINTVAGAIAAAQ